MDRRCGKNCGQSAGRYPAPPIAYAGEIREHRVVGSKGFGAGGGDAPDSPGIHQYELGPGRRGHPTEQQADDE